MMGNVTNNSNIVTPWPDQFFNATLLTNGNFLITDNYPIPSMLTAMPGTSNDVFSYVYSGFTETTPADVARNKRLQSGYMYLNLDSDDIRSYVYFGKASDVVIQEINDIILGWPASLYLDNLNDPTIRTATGVYYNPYSDTTTFKVPIHEIFNKVVFVNGNVFPAVSNPYGVVYSDDKSWDTSFLNLMLNYTAYTITRVSGNTLSEEYPILSFTGISTFDGTVSGASDLRIVCHGNPFMVSTLNTPPPVNMLSVKYHIKPAQMYIDKFFAGLTELQNRILNRYSLPKYEFSVRYLMDDDDVNVTYKQSVYWPTTDYYNLDLDTVEFRKYLSDIRSVLEMYDDTQTDIMYRRLTEDGVLEYDLTDDEKISKYIRAWAWSYDKDKRYIDGISFVNNVSYNKKNNLPDDLIIDHAKKLGWDVYSPFRDMPENVLYERDVLDLMYPGWSTNYNLLEIETEIWRRLAINSIYYFKSKGTRKGVESILSLLGIPDNMLTLNEYVYLTDPIDFNDTMNYLMLLNGATYSAGTSGGTYVFELTTSASTLDTVWSNVNNYLIALVNNPDYASVLGTGTLTGFPISPTQNDTTFFQCNGGWLESDPSYVSPDYYDSGKKWLDTYRLLGNTQPDNFMIYYTYSGAPTGGVEIIPQNIGFTLHKTVDNVKSWVEDIKVTGNTGLLGVYYRYCDIPGRETDYTGTTGLVINTKEVDMFLDFSKVITSGNCVTTLDAGGSQIGWLPITPTNYIEGPTYSNLIEYVENLDKFWIDIVKQVIPSTTIFRVGVVYSNCKTGQDEYYLYNFPSTSDNLHFLNPYTALSGDQFSVISGYTFSFSGYGWTETSWLQYQSEVNPGLDPFNPFNMYSLYNASLILGYPGIVYFPTEMWGDPAYDINAF
jgi:hypothetical protein